MLKKFGRNRKLIVGAILVLLTLVGTLLLIYSNPSFVFKQNRDAEQGTSMEPVGELTKGTEIEQTFLCSKDRLASIELNFGTYERVNSGTINVTLTNRTEEEVVESWMVDCSTIVNNSFYTFALSEVAEGVRDDQLAIEITSDTGTSGNAVTVLMADDDAGRTLYMAGSELGADLALSLNYNSYTLAWYNLINLMTYVLVILALGALVIWKMYRFHILEKLKKAPDFFRKNMGRIVGQCLVVALLAGISIAIEYFISYVIEGAENSLGSYFNMYRWIFLFTAELAVYFLLLYRRKVIKSVETLFLALILCTGGLFAFTLPIATNIAWDDQIHFSNVVKLSYLTNCKYTQTDYDIIDIRYPTTFNMNEVETNLEKMNALYNDDIVLSFDKEYGLFYASIGYLPAALTMRAARTVGVPFEYVFVLGKLANLIVYGALCFFGMRKLKWGKMMFGVVALLPTNIFLATNYSYDYWVIGFVMLGMACLIGELQQPEKKLEKRDLLIMIGALVLGMGPKAIYFLMVLLCLLLGKGKFKTEKQYKQFWIAVVCTGILVAVSFVLPFLFAGEGGNDPRGGSAVNSIEQVKFILFHPLQYTKILLNFFVKDYFNIANAVKYTNNLAYLGLGSLSSVSLILMAVSACMDRNSLDTRILTKRFRISIFACFFCTASLIATALYVSFTPVASETINGCQHRYLIPMLFIALYCFGSGRVETRISKRVFNSLILAVSGYVIFYEYWVMCISRYI